MNLVELERAFAERNIKRVKVGGFDVDGVLRGKMISLERFRRVVESGFGFCDAIFGWDITDTMYDDARVTGWHSGFPDARAMIDIDTFRVLPAEPDTAAFLVDFAVATEGSALRPHPACPRSLLKRILARARAKGFVAKVGPELEFWVFKESSDTLHAKDFRDLRPLSHGMCGFSWAQQEREAAFGRAIMDEMAAFDVELEAIHTETGPGVYEVAIRYDEALRAADKAALFKTQMKSLAERHGLFVTFMAKWNSDLPGSSGHLHQSLWSEAPPRNLFHDPAGEGGLSTLARRYIAGQIELMPELTALYSPTVNAYKRTTHRFPRPDDLSGSRALTASWGFDHRACAIRVLGEDAESTRIEYRQTAADINPYIAIATSLAAGLWGIENELEPPAPARGDARSSGARSLPRTLEDATRLLSASTRARQLLGDDFVDHYVRARDWEARQYERAVTDWELRRYFEAV